MDVHGGLLVASEMFGTVGCDKFFNVVIMFGKGNWLLLDVFRSMQYFIHLYYFNLLYIYMNFIHNSIYLKAHTLCITSLEGPPWTHRGGACSPPAVCAPEMVPPQHALAPSDAGLSDGGADDDGQKGQERCPQQFSTSGCTLSSLILDRVLNSSVIRVSAKAPWLGG